MLRSTRIPAILHLVPGLSGAGTPLPPPQQLTNPRLLITASHANSSRQWIRHGLSRHRDGPPPGLRARLALRFPQLVGRAGTAEREAPRRRREPAAFLSRTLGRQGRNLFARPT